jgi:hypothetical protein
MTAWCLCVLVVKGFEEVAGGADIALYVGDR